MLREDVAFRKHEPWNKPLPCPNSKYLRTWKPFQWVHWQRGWRAPVCQCEGDLIGLNVGRKRKFSYPISQSKYNGCASLSVGSSQVTSPLELGLEWNMCPSLWLQDYNTALFFLLISFHTVRCCHLIFDTSVSWKGYWRGDIQTRRTSSLPHCANSR